MTTSFTNTWESKRTPETRTIEDLLRRTFEQADSYRYNSASIRIRVIDKIGQREALGGDRVKIDAKFRRIAQLAQQMPSMRAFRSNQQRPGQRFAQIGQPSASQGCDNLRAIKTERGRHLDGETAGEQLGNRLPRQPLGMAAEHAGGIVEHRARPVLQLNLQPRQNIRAQITDHAEGDIMLRQARRKAEIFYFILKIS